MLQIWFCLIRIWFWSERIKVDACLQNCKIYLFSSKAKHASNLILSDHNFMLIRENQIWRLFVKLQKNYVFIKSKTCFNFNSVWSEFDSDQRESKLTPVCKTAKTILFIKSKTCFKFDSVWSEFDVDQRESNFTPVCKITKKLCVRQKQNALHIWFCIKFDVCL